MTKQYDRRNQMGGTMKRTLIAAALFAGLITHAGAAPPTWQGDMFITAVNSLANCNAVNLVVGDFARTILRPRNLTGESGPIDLIAFHFNRSAVQLVPTTPAGGVLNGATAATIRIIYGSSGFNQFTGNAITASLSPYPVLLATPDVSVTMTIANAYSKGPPSPPSNCNITVRGVLGKRLS
jgi:hypothetical protein